MGCERVSVCIGDLRERTRERRSRCDEELNDSMSAALCTFAARAPRQRGPVGLVKADAAVPPPSIWTAAAMRAFKRADMWKTSGRHAHRMHTCLPKRKVGEVGGQSLGRIVCPEPVDE